MSTVIELFQYDFFLKAFIAAVFASISCGIIGSYIVSRRIVFISGGITHASFGGIGLAFFLGFNPILGAVIFAVFSALGIQFFTKVAEIREDSSIAIWWSLGMALGIIFVFLTPGYTTQFNELSLWEYTHGYHFRTLVDVYFNPCNHCIFCTVF
ncbi:MAG: metal ABC transporter permease [Dermatophilaceae bacterium]